MCKANLSRLAWIEEEIVVGLMGMSLPKWALKVGFPIVLHMRKWGPQGKMTKVKN